MSNCQTAAAYIRVSTDEQTEFSPDSQIKRIKEYARSHGLILADKHIFTDEGISGREASRRPAFNRMIGLAKTKPRPFDVILVWKFSRFARNREDSIVYKSMLRKQCGISVVSVSESLGDDKTSVLIEALIEAMDEYYSINLAEEVKRGMTEKAARGGVVSAAAFGYRVENGQFVPTDNAQIVRSIFEDFVNGEGYRSIAAKYGGMGIKTRAGKPIDNRFVEYLVRNPVYIGKIRWSPDGNGAGKRVFDNPDDIISDGTHQPIVSERLFYQAQERIKNLKSRYAKHQHPEQSARTMFKGLVRCSACGATLIYAGGKNPILQCHNYTRGSCKISHAISVDRLTNAVIADIAELICQTSFNVDVKPKTNLSAENADKLIARERQKLARAREAYTAGVDTLEEYRAAKLQIQHNISEIQSNIPKTNNTTQVFTATAQSTLDALICPYSTNEQKNLALRAIIRNIVYQKKNGSIKVEYYI